jgi:hypothetical protein
MTNPTSEDARLHYEDPEPGRWRIDAVHSFVSFSVLHMNVSYARGIAVGPTGTITIAPNLLDSSVEATIDASTLTTLNPVRDAKMRGSDLLDAATPGCHGHYRALPRRLRRRRVGHVLLPGGGFMLPHHLKVTLDIEATKDEEAA